MKLEIRSAARCDLAEISAYIARDNPLRASSFARDLSDKIRMVADRPLSFPARDEWQTGARSAVHGKYHIVFRVEEKRVIVLRILHAARNLPDIV